MMRLTICTLIAACWGGLAYAQTFACQSLNAGGLFWESGEWRVGRVKGKQPFFLKMNGQELDLSSVGKALWGEHENQPSCRRHAQNDFSCADKLGNFMFFDPRTGNGGFARLLGAGQPTAEPKKDTVTAEAFTCQKM